MSYKDLTTEKFGRLTPVRKVGSYRGSATWICLCDCGRLTNPIPSNNLRTGNTTSCGCLSSRYKRKHGQTDTRTYRSWASMIQRTSNPNHRWFDRYGGRGITVCDGWKVFANFLRDMGERPVGKTLDRINNDGDYEPGNCRWASPKEQANNTKHTNK